MFLRFESGQLVSDGSKIWLHIALFTSRKI